MTKVAGLGCRSRRRSRGPTRQRRGPAARSRSRACSAQPMSDRQLAAAWSDATTCRDTFAGAGVGRIDRRQVFGRRKAQVGAIRRTADGQPITPTVRSASSSVPITCPRGNIRHRPARISTTPTSMRPVSPTASAMIRCSGKSRTGQQSNSHRDDADGQNALACDDRNALHDIPPCYWYCLFVVSRSPCFGGSLPPFCARAETFRAVTFRGFDMVGRRRLVAMPRSAGALVDGRPLGPDRCAVKA